MKCCNETIKNSTQKEALKGKDLLFRKVIEGKQVME
jgi:hypothetical protein